MFSVVVSPAGTAPAARHAVTAVRQTEAAVCEYVKLATRAVPGAYGYEAPKAVEVEKPDV